MNGPWIGAVLLGLAGPVVVPLGLVAVPTLVGLSLNRPSATPLAPWLFAIGYAVLLYVASGIVLTEHRGEVYFAKMPKLVTVAHLPPQTPEEKRTVAWLDQLKAAGLNVQLKMPIDFYGIAVDQDGKPLSDVHFKYSPNDGGVHDTEQVAISSADGIVHISKLHGLGLEIIAFKDGYSATPGSVSMGFFNFVDYTQPNFCVADPDHPVVFKFTRSPRAEPLYSWSGYLPLIESGSTVYLDPKPGKRQVPRRENRLQLRCSMSISKRHQRLGVRRKPYQRSG